MANFIKPFETAEELKKRSNTSAQTFDRKNITITKGGKTINVYDMIQAAREDTEIYPTLQKYGCLKTMETNAELVYGEIDTAMNLQDIYQQDLKLQQIFDELPADERKEFDNDFYKFKEKGLEYYNNKAKKEIETANNLRKKQTEQKGDTANESNK